MSWLVIAAPGVGLAVLLFSLRLPDWLETVLVLSFIVGGVPMAVLVSVRLDKHDEQGFLSRITLSQSEADLFKEWERSGKLVTMIDGVTEGQIDRLILATQKVYGTYVARTWRRPNGKIVEEKLPKVGFKVLATGPYSGADGFNVILYRRDLAKADRIRRPWRHALRRNGAVQLTRSYPPVELPNWIA
jgi:hypothetical protein